MSYFMLPKNEQKLKVGTDPVSTFIVLFWIAYLCAIPFVAINCDNQSSKSDYGWESINSPFDDLHCYRGTQHFDVGHPVVCYPKPAEQVNF